MNVLRTCTRLGGSGVREGTRGVSVISHICACDSLLKRCGSSWVVEVSECGGQATSGRLLDRS